MNTAQHGTRSLILVAAVAASVASPAFADSAIYGGGPFYSGGTPVMNDLRASGFTTVMLWSIHVDANGDLNLNDQKLVSKGAYVGTNTSWSAQLQTLKQAPTSVNRIEVSIGSGGVADFEHIRDLVNSTASGGGTGPNSILYRNFQVLRQVTGADAADFDDESAYDLASATAFGKMLAGQGYKITFVPYTNQGFWSSLKSNLGASVDRIYLQVYDGGAGNDPKQWSSALGMTVRPGLWSLHGSGCASGDSPSSVKTRMTAWKASTGIPGGFMWLYDDIQKCSASGRNTADYAAAINGAVASRTASADFGASSTGLTSTFAGQVNPGDARIVTQRWNFGDGSQGAGATASHTYARAGTYPVTLTVVDEEGHAQSKTRNVSVAE
ncbi:PKD domain-containing protein [Luteibacter sp. PPL201]|uniref:PKD domain-containing protein n=1 Tax=Luteibacter sahnii TaxID=3021977 RepID=A0ABT6BAR0_9GAMM|nr:PKD domain-containing protein [Luteibacter sp. PPL193]MDY1547192.1 PKD domain-containing protein [Luteibacter sp. PPL193]